MRRFDLLCLVLLCLALPGLSGLVGGCAPRGVDVVMHDALQAQRDGDVDHAIARYRRALKIEPRVRGAYNNLAVIALAKGNLTQAVKLLEEELALHPRSPEGNRNLAIVLLRLGRPDDAIARVEALASVSGGAPTSRPDRRAEQDEARLVLAVARWKAGQSSALVRQPLELVLSPPPPGTPPDVRAALQRRARVALAYRALEDGEAGATPESPETDAAQDAPIEIRWMRVIRALRDGQPDEALVALDAMDASPETVVLRASALARTDRAEEAAGLLDAIDVAELPAPFAVVFHRIRASLAAAKGDWRGALADLQRADEGASGRDPDITMDRAVAMARLGNGDGARALVEAVVRDSPGNARATALADALR